MLPITIDFRKQPGSKWTGWVVLGAALLLGADLVNTKLDLEQQLAKWEQTEGSRKETTSRTGDAEKGGREGRAEVEMEEAAGVIRQLVMPWSLLFQSFERAHSDNVALLSLQPDSQRRVVTVVGEAKEYEDALAYVARLREEAQFTNAHLVASELKENDPQRPILFTVLANWKSAP